MWYIGQKVVCIDDTNQGNATIITRYDKVIKGNVYTIKSFASIGSIRLLEVNSGMWADGEEAGFLPRRFSPILGDSIEFAEETLERIKTNIEIEIEEPILN